MLKDASGNLKIGENGDVAAESPKVIPDEILTSLVAVLDAVRLDAASSRPEIMRRTGLGRGVVVQRVDELIARGIFIEAGLEASSGGRAPRTIRLNTHAGHILVADLGATSIGVGIADLSGQLGRDINL